MPRPFRPSSSASFAFAVLALLPVACGPVETSGAPAAAAPTDPKAAIAHQLALLKAGDVDGVKACLTPRLRDAVTPELVGKAKEEAAKFTLDDLVAGVEDEATDSGAAGAKITMKNGRTLTHLVKDDDGRWLADTIWFK